MSCDTIRTIHELSEEVIQTAQGLFIAGRKRFGALMDADILTQAKCYFYSGLYQMSMLRPFHAWRHFMQGLDTCLAFRTRPSKSGEPPNAEEGVYWLCWKSEHELRAELDLPDFTINGLDHPHMSPILPSDCEGEHLRACYFYLAGIPLWRIETTNRKQIAAWIGLNPAARLEQLADHVTSLEDPIRSWKASLPPEISLDNGPSAGEDVITYVLKGRLTCNYDMLTWPFVHVLLHGRCHGDVAMDFTMRGLSVHLNRLSTRRSAYFYRHHGTQLMQRSSARSAMILLAAAVKLTPAFLPHG